MIEHDQTLIARLVDQKDFKKIRLYVELGFELTLQDINGEHLGKFGNPNSRVFKCIIDNNLQQVRKISSFNFNSPNDENYSPLQWAIIIKRNDIAMFLLENGADITATNNNGENAFFLAARFNNHIMMHKLLQMTSNVDTIFCNNNRGFNALIAACYNKNNLIISMLLKIAESKHILQRNIGGANCLHWLAHGSKIDDNKKFQLIASFIEDVEQKIRCGNRIISKLIAHKNAIEYTPLNWLERFQNGTILHFLKDRV